MNKSRLFVLSITSLLLLSGCRRSSFSSTPRESSGSNGSSISSVTSANSSISEASSIDSSSESSASASSLSSIVSTLNPSSAPDVGNYYDSISDSLTGSSLRTALYTLTKANHTKYSYDNMEIAMRTTDRNWEKSPDPDDEDPYMVLLYMVDNDTKPHRWKESYGGYGSTKAGEYCWDKEHMWPKSNGFPEKKNNAYSDLHHLRASDKGNNQARGSQPYGNVSSGETCKDANGDNSGILNGPYMPAAKYRGDCARAIFYMATRYMKAESGDCTTALDITTGTDSSNGKWGYLNDLLKWHDDDPPDAWEINRNSLVYAIQKNRNPFIDHPEYARKIWG